MRATSAAFAGGGWAEQEETLLSRKGIETEMF
jgi:hypothetical protein